MRQKWLNPELTNNTFGYYAKGWWLACEPYITRSRETKRDDSLFSEFQWLASQMSELTSQEEADFLKEERFQLADR